MSSYKTTYHRDGTITYWDVYEQVWHRASSADISDRIMASFSHEEREKIERHAKSYAKHNG